MSSGKPSAEHVRLEGTVNVRDVGGLATTDGARVRRGVLLRSAHLQHLTDEDVRVLRDHYGVRTVVDLRTEAEVASAGPGPLHAEPGIVVRHRSLYPDGATFARISGDGPPAVSAAAPGQVGLLNGRDEPAADGRPAFVDHYLRYLRNRPDSMLGAFRDICAPGAAIVHCAAGKDRTGVVIALVLSAVGVAPELVAADYAATEPHLDAIAALLRRNDLYARAMSATEPIPAPSAELMLAVLEAIEEDHDGVCSWLAGQGWTSEDQARLQAALLDPPHA